MQCRCFVVLRSTESSDGVRLCASGEQSLLVGSLSFTFDGVYDNTAPGTGGTERLNDAVWATAVPSGTVPPVCTHSILLVGDQASTRSLISALAYRWLRVPNAVVGFCSALPCEAKRADAKRISASVFSAKAQSSEDVIRQLACAMTLEIVIGQQLTVVCCVDTLTTSTGVAFLRSATRADVWIDVSSKQSEKVLCEQLTALQDVKGGLNTFGPVIAECEGGASLSQQVSALEDFCSGMCRSESERDAMAECVRSLSSALLEANTEKRLVEEERDLHEKNASAFEVVVHELQKANDLLQAELDAYAQSTSQFQRNEQLAVTEKGQLAAELAAAKDAQARLSAKAAQFENEIAQLRTQLQQARAAAEAPKPSLEGEAHRVEAEVGRLSNALKEEQTTKMQLLKEFQEKERLWQSVLYRSDGEKQRLSKDNDTLRAQCSALQTALSEAQRPRGRVPTREQNTETEAPMNVVAQDSPAPPRMLVVDETPRHPTLPSGRDFSTISKYVQPISSTSALLLSPAAEHTAALRPNERQVDI